MSECLERHDHADRTGQRQGENQQDKSDFERGGHWFDSMSECLYPSR